MKLIKFSDSQSEVKSYVRQDGTRVKNFLRRNKKKILAGVGASALLGGAYLLNRGKRPLPKAPTSVTPDFTLSPTTGLKRYPVDPENDAFLNIIVPHTVASQFQDSLGSYKDVTSLIGEASHFYSGVLKDAKKHLTTLSFDNRPINPDSPAEAFLSIRIPKGKTSFVDGKYTSQNRYKAMRYELVDALPDDVEYEIPKATSLWSLDGLENYVRI